MRPVYERLYAGAPGITAVGRADTPMCEMADTGAGISSRGSNTSSESSENIEHLHELLPQERGHALTMAAIGRIVYPQLCGFGNEMVKTFR